MDPIIQSPSDIESLQGHTRKDDARTQLLEHILVVALRGIAQMGDAGAQLLEDINDAVMGGVEMQVVEDILNATIPTQAQRNSGKLKEASTKQPDDESIRFFVPHEPVNREQKELNQERVRAEQARKDRETAEAEFKQFSDCMQKQFATLQNYEVELKKHIAELEKRIHALVAMDQRLGTQIAQKQAVLAKFEI